MIQSVYRISFGPADRDTLVLFLACRDISFTPSIPAVGQTQPPVQSVSGTFLWGKTAGCQKLTTHLRLVSMLRMGGAIPQFSHMPS